MDWYKKTTDWQVCCIGQVAGGAVVAGGWFLFVFYSAEAGGSAYVVFSGIGAGAGGNISGVLNPEDYGAVSAPWSSMYTVPYMCGVHPFSINDMNGANGRISCASGGLDIIGYGVTYITAGNSSATDAYFFAQNVGGLGFGEGSGFGFSADILSGGWTFLKESWMRP